MSSRSNFGFSALTAVCTIETPLAALYRLKVLIVFQRIHDELATVHRRSRSVMVSLSFVAATDNSCICLALKHNSSDIDYAHLCDVATRLVAVIQ